MAYADFTYYDQTYLGNVIAETDFPRLAARASTIIDQLTYNRTAAVVTADEDADLIDKIKMAVCAVAEEFYKTEQNAQNASGVIQSERAGQSSVTYVVTEEAKQSSAQRYYNAAYLYLGQTALMFAGLNENER